jgi:hypothetical protein
MSKNQNKCSLIELSKIEHVEKAFKDLPDAFKILDDTLEPFSYLTKDLPEKFLHLRDARNVHDWLQLLFEHHIIVQKQKPPKGKAPWVLDDNTGNYLLNNTQSIDPDLNDEYVNQYRTFSLQSFMKDLGKI